MLRTEIIDICKEIQAKFDKKVDFVTSLNGLEEKWFVYSPFTRQIVDMASKKIYNL